MSLRKFARIPLLAAAGLLAGCAGEQSRAAFVDPGATYRLQEISGEPFRARATLRFSPDGSVRGQAPCNSFAFRINAPYPWFEAGPIRSTRSICPQIREERAFFRALSGMSLAEVGGDVLLLQDDAGREMVFVRQDGSAGATPKAAVPVPPAPGG